MAIKTQYSDIHHTRRLVKHSDVTQQQLADIYGVDIKTIRRYLHGGDNCPNTLTCRIVRKDAFELYGYRFA